MTYLGIVCMILVATCTMTGTESRASAKQAISEEIVNSNRNTAKRGLFEWIYSQIFKAIACMVEECSQAREKACGTSDCQVAGCTSDKYDKGWYIRGTDLGCCGNYQGCCTFAHQLCYLHDKRCLCCGSKFWCGPSCRKHHSCRK